MMSGLSSEKIKFPVSYQLKVIMDSAIGDEENKAFIKETLVKLNINHGQFGHKRSSEGTYTSYTVEVTVHNLTIMRLLYSELKASSAVKFAL